MSQNASAESRLQRLKKILLERPKASDTDKPEAVVGVLLFDQPGKGLETLLIQRPEKLGDPWSGQVGFPGGRIKNSDNSPRAALRREVEEEVGIDLEPGGEELGTLTIGRPGRNPEVRVQPWVYALKRKPPLKTNDEVEEAFWVALPVLPSKLTKAQVEIRGQRWTVDCYLVDGHIVWGFTFRVLGDLLTIPEINSPS